MTDKTIINTDSAPAAIGVYSQAVKVDNTVYLAGQIPLVPESMSIVDGDFQAQAHQVFKNLRAVCTAAGGKLQDIVKLNLTNQTKITDRSNCFICFCIAFCVHLFSVKDNFRSASVTPYKDIPSA